MKNIRNFWKSLDTVGKILYCVMCLLVGICLVGIVVCVICGNFGKVNNTVMYSTFTTLHVLGMM